MTGKRAEEPPPKLPRGRWFGKGPRHIEILRIGMVGTLFVVILVMGRPCADGMARFVESFAGAPDAGPAAKPTVRYERLTEEEIKRRFPSGDAAPPGDAAP